MMKSIAIALVIVLLGLLAWVVFQSSNVSIIVNGQKLSGPVTARTGSLTLVKAITTNAFYRLTDRAAP